jgi:hypothetical protein
VIYLGAEQIRQMVEMAEQARGALSCYVGYEVAYNTTGVQLLDEWVDRHVRQFAEPSEKVYLLWVSFLGEMFRRHHGGEWVVRGKGGPLGVLCPTGDGGQHVVDVAGQVRRRIARGMSASLTYFYTMTSIDLRAQQ